MGRKRKYHTIEEKREANRSDWKRWYDKNKEKLNAQRMRIYYERRIDEMGKILSKLREDTDVW